MLFRHHPRRHWFLFIAALCVPFLSSVAGEANSPKDIQSLLNEAEGALLGKPAKTSDEPAKPKPKKKAPPARVETREVTDAPPKAESIPQLTPIDTTAIQNVIAVDLKASEREREPMYPVTQVTLAGGMQWLGSNYALTKDDDVFSDDNGGHVQGAYLSFSPTWRLGFPETSWLRTFVSAVFGAGYSQGTVVMHRAGIQTSDANYSIKLFPVDAGLQVSAELGKRFSVFFGYGPGIEVFHQDGQGVTDSVTDIFYGDEIWFGLGAKLSSSLGLVLTYKRKGTNLLLHSDSFSGQVLTAGVSFGFSG